MFLRARSLSVSAVAITLTAFVAGCSNEEIKYVPKPAASGEKASLPPVPNVPKKPIKNGDVYTVYGAAYHLRSRVHHEEVAKKKLTITGYITKNNFAQAPECAVHKGGKADPQGCVAPVPTFWIADSKDAPESEQMAVMGWASNFAQIFDAIAEYDKKEDAEYSDTMWGVKLPNPLPAKGAKVTVTGTYATTFTQASAGTESDPIMGILTWQEMKYDEQPSELATLPGIERKPPK
jgi:hypothetical protein